MAKRKLKSEDYEHSLEATQLENKINKLEKNKFEINRLRENHKEYIENNKLKLKPPQRYSNQKHHVFTMIKMINNRNDNDKNCN